MNVTDQREGLRRLLVLADFLETVPASRFHMDVWVGDDWKGAADLSCGTAACAMGWATTIPEFQQLGLRLVAFSRYGGRPQFYGYQDFEAAVAFFRIDECDANMLFTSEPDRNESPKVVATRLRDFVSERVKRLDAEAT